jgi:hypothetical protein
MSVLKKQVFILQTAEPGLSIAAGRVASSLSAAFALPDSGRKTRQVNASQTNCVAPLLD